MRTNSSGKKSGFGYWIGSLLLLSVALILPVLAVIRLTAIFESKYVLSYLVIVWIITFAMYRSDKLNAQKGEWRTPEGNLHFLEWIGGWAAAFLAQRLFWHKISKRAYQVSFWFIGVAHNLVSFDFLNGWQYSKLIYQSTKPLWR